MLFGVFPPSASPLPVPPRRAQVALETLIVFAGLFAFFAAFFAATQPLRDSALSKTIELQEKTAFERVRFAVLAASSSTGGSSFSVDFELPANVTVGWNRTALRWLGKPGGGLAAANAGTLASDNAGGADSGKAALDRGASSSVEPAALVIGADFSESGSVELDAGVHSFVASRRDAVVLEWS